MVRTLQRNDRGDKKKIRGIEAIINKCLIKQDMSKNILLEANKIINERSQEKERMYGPMQECMQRCADIASLITQKEITSRDVHIVMIAMKFAREAYSHKEDNLLDAAAYIASLNELEEGE